MRAPPATLRPMNYFPAVVIDYDPTDELLDEAVDVEHADQTDWSPLVIG
jgi:hypothetical protein